MTTMIERVARAICAATDVTPENALGGPYFDNPDSLYYFGKPMQSATRWNLYVPAARSAIAAMRAPTEGMLAGTEAPGTWGVEPRFVVPVGYENGPIYREQCAEIYQAMIDAALEEKP